MKGWIYILSNDAVPDWIAIGCSDSDPEALVRQYGNSGIKLPYPFHLQYALRTPYPKTLLQKIHDELAPHCVNPDSNNDWFEYDLLNGIRIVRQIAGNSATGEAFYNQARKLVEQAQTHQQAITHFPPAEETKPTSPVQQIRTVPPIQRGKRPSPIAPQIAPPPPEPQPESTPTPKKENPKLIALLMIIWVILLMILVFLIAYVFGYI